MAWSVWVCDTVSGAKIQRLPVSAFSWSRVLNGSGSGSATVKLNDSALKKLNPLVLTAPVSNTLVLDWDGVVVYAGVIWSRDYTREGTSLTLEHSDIWSVLSRRFAVNHYEGAVELWKATYTAMTLRQFTKYLMVLGLYADANANMMLPITLPADEVGTIKRTVYGYHLGNLVDSLEDVMNEANGPDIDFRPRWVGGALNWEMRVGSTANPKLTAGTYEWNMSAAKSGMFDLKVKEDAAKLVTNMVAVGEGTEQDMLIRSNRIVNPSYPHLERALSYKSVSDGDALYDLANGGLQVYKTPTTQWSFSVKASGTPKAGGGFNERNQVTTFLPGGTARVYVQSDPWLSNGWHSHRLVQFSGDLSEDVKLEFQPDGGV